MSLQEDCRMNRWPARDTTTTFYECVCVYFSSHCRNTCWGVFDTGLNWCCRLLLWKSPCFLYLCLTTDIWQIGLQTILPVEKITPARVTEHLPEHVKALPACFLSCSAYSRLQTPCEALQFFWFHWYQCYTLVNVCFSSSGNCKTLYKHSLTSDSKEKPKGAMIQNSKVALSIVLLSNRLLPSQPCSR